MAGVKLTAFQEEQLKAYKKVLEYKEMAEANIISIIFKEPDCIFNYDLKLDDFNKNCWKVYFVILEDLIVKEKKIPDDTTITFYLEKHPKLSKQFDEYGGFKTLEDASAYVKVENLDGYVEELYRFKAILNLVSKGFPVYNRLSEFVDMSADEIYNEYEAILAHTFTNISSGIKSYNLLEGAHDLLNELNKGKNVGLPLYNSPLLNKYIGGNLIGNMTLCAGISGAGKSTMAINLILPEIIKQDEAFVVFLNEQEKDAWLEQLMLWTANNIFSGEIDKVKLRDGNIDEDSLKILRKACDWIEEKKDKKRIIIIPLQKYKCEDVVKLIKKYSAMSVKYFCLDTFKPSTDAKGDMYWQSLMQDSVKLYDTIKKSNRNVHLWLTYQLEKGSAKARYLSVTNLAVSKNITDVMSTTILFRRAHPDEFEGEKREIIYQAKVGNSYPNRKLKKGEEYIIIFIDKNRFGKTGVQILAKFDLGKNKYEECGIVNITPDF